MSYNLMNSEKDFHELIKMLTYVMKKLDLTN